MKQKLSFSILILLICSFFLIHGCGLKSLILEELNRDIIEETVPPESNQDVNEQEPSPDENTQGESPNIPDKNPPKQPPVNSPGGEEPADNSDDETPAEEPAEEEPNDETPAEESTDEEPADDTTDDPVDEPSDEPTDNTSDDPNTNDEPTDNSDEEAPAEEPAEEEPGDETPAEEPTDEEAPAEEPAEEEPGDETPAEEPTDEEPTDNSDDETPAEEPAEEEPGDETPAEEPTDEEAPAEEPAEEEPGDETPAEEPTDEEPTDNSDEEAPAEEPAEEEPGDETPAEEPTDETPGEEPADDTADDPVDEPSDEPTDNTSDDPNPNDEPTDNSDDETPAEEPAEEEPGDETPAEEPTDEEAPAEEPTDETPGEEPDDDTTDDPVDEPSDEPTDNTSDDPNPNDEPTDNSDDETPAEEPAEEEPGDETLTEEPGDEEPTDETPVEEPTDEEPTNETPDEEPADEEPTDDIPLNLNIQDLNLTDEGYSGYSIVAINLSANDSGSKQTAGDIPLALQSMLFSQDFDHHEHVGFTEKQFDHEEIKAKYYTGALTTSGSIIRGKLPITDDTTDYSFKYFNESGDTITTDTVRVYNGEYCYIFVRKDFENDIDLSVVQEVGEFFDETIYPRSTGLFEQFPDDLDENGKVVLFYADIESDGYFMVYDLYSSLYYGISNEADMIYIHERFLSTGSNVTTVPENARIIAHEFQHLLNRSYRFEADNGYYEWETWLEEGLAEGATKFVLEYNHEDHFEYIGKKGKIRNGLSIFNWDNSYFNYSLAHTFLEYARIQSGMGVEFYKNLMKNTHIGNDYKALMDIVENNAIDESGAKFESIGDLVRDFNLAILINGETGRYSFGNDSGNEYQNLLVTPKATTSSTPTIGPGGSVMFHFDEETDEFRNFEPSGEGNNIEYFRINKTIP